MAEYKILGDICLDVSHIIVISKYFKIPDQPGHSLVIELTIADMAGTYLLYDKVAQEFLAYWNETHPEAPL